MDQVDTVRSEICNVSNTGELQQLRRVDGSAAANHFTGMSLESGGAVAGVKESLAFHILDPYRPLAFKEDAGGEGSANNREVWTVHDRVQISPSCTPTPAIVHIAIKGCKTLLLKTIHIVGDGIARLLAGLEKRLE